MAHREGCGRLLLARISGRVGHAWTALADFRFAPAGATSSRRLETAPSATKRKWDAVLPMLMRLADEVRGAAARETAAGAAR
jgi:hypothetical protein